MLDAETIARLKDLKYIGVLATGYNVVDVDAVSQEFFAAFEKAVLVHKNTEPQPGRCVLRVEFDGLAIQFFALN